MFGYLACLGLYPVEGLFSFVYGIVNMVQGPGVFCHSAWHVWDFNRLCVRISSIEVLLVHSRSNLEWTVFTFNTAWCDFRQCFFLRVEAAEAFLGLTEAHGTC